MRSELVTFVCPRCGHRVEAPSIAQVFCTRDEQGRRHRPVQRCRPVVTAYDRDDLARRAALYHRDLGGDAA